MKNSTLKLSLLVSIVALSFASCSYKGECKCGSITVEGEYDSKDDYQDAKAACELADCEWKRNL